MSDEQTAPDAEQPPGWQVLDADGNVVDSGNVVQLEAVTDTGESVDPGSAVPEGTNG